MNVFKVVIIVAQVICLVNLANDFVKKNRKRYIIFFGKNSNKLFNMVISGSPCKGSHSLSKSVKTLKSN